MDEYCLHIYPPFEASHAYYVTRSTTVYSNFTCLLHAMVYQLYCSCVCLFTNKNYKSRVNSPHQFLDDLFMDKI